MRLLALHESAGELERSPRPPGRGRGEARADSRRWNRGWKRGNEREEEESRGKGREGGCSSDVGSGSTSLYPIVTKDALLYHAVSCLIFLSFLFLFHFPISALCASCSYLETSATDLKLLP